MQRDFILAINPGSTSTKVAIFKEKELIASKNLSHSAEEIDSFDRVSDQINMRRDVIIEWMESIEISTKQLKAVVGRGGLLAPMPGGTYVVTETMINDLVLAKRGEHASNLGAIIAKSIAQKENIKSYIVDPVSVDEFDDVARISGMPELERKSQGHALNIKAVARKVSQDLNKEFKDLRLIVAHLGGGISVCPVANGKNLDYNNANEMGPFSPERACGLPVFDLVKMCYSNDYTEKEMQIKLKGKGGLVAYLGTNDAREVEAMIKENNQKAKLIYEAMGYQISKEIGAMATVLKGNLDAVVLTGGLAHSRYLVDYIRSKVEFLGRFIVIAGEDEMMALNLGALRVENKEEVAKIYEEEVEI